MPRQTTADSVRRTAGVDTASESTSTSTLSVPAFPSDHPYSRTLHNRRLAAWSSAPRPHRDGAAGATRNNNNGGRRHSSHLSAPSPTVGGQLAPAARTWPSALYLRELHPGRVSLMPWTATSLLPRGPPTRVKSYPSRVYCGTYSEDGALYYTGTQGMVVDMFDTRASPTLQRVRKSYQRSSGQWTITDVCMTADNRWVANASIEPQVYLISTDPEVERNQCINFARPVNTSGRNSDRSGGGNGMGRGLGYGSRLRLHRPAGSGVERSFGIWSLRFSHDGRELLAGSNTCDLFLHDIERQTNVAEVIAHEDEINAVCFADLGSNIIFSGSDDGFIRVWDRRILRSSNSQPTGHLFGHTEGITFLEAKGDGQHCVSNSKDQTMKLWDIRRMLSSFSREGRESRRLSMDWDYRFDRYPGKAGGRKHAYDCSVQTFVGHSVLKTLIRCHFSPAHTTGQRYLYSGSADGKIYIYNMDGTIARTLESNTSSTAAAQRGTDLPHPSAVRTRNHRSIATSQDESDNDSDGDEMEAPEEEEEEDSVYVSSFLGSEPDSEMEAWVDVENEYEEEVEEEVRDEEGADGPNDNSVELDDRGQPRTPPNRASTIRYLNYTLGQDPDATGESDHRWLLGPLLELLTGGTEPRMISVDGSTVIIRPNEADEDGRISLTIVRGVGGRMGEDPTPLMAAGGRQGAARHFHFSAPPRLAPNVIRDVAWHPFEPTILATSYAGNRSYSLDGHILKFDYRG
ncbi:hypothetical protein IWQ60_008590 [Tieghemiomyces parasiticus]|uniref:WD40 repeat-like protein n=1 Tax=Tieghemiomyces parasiticus TaxID=78921 RepID=A0A9W7ZXZ9_9FUNG|nr:hypothetical protein IWQ60_008590 [Tieghemiomyces parasiticus]